MARSLGSGALIVACTQGFAEGAVLLRNILLARLLGPEEMGLAVMLAIVLRCLEMISYLGADRLLVQARDGNTWRFQANAHGLELIRGILAGALMMSLSYPTAIVFGYPEIAWAFAALGLAPVIKGFTHLDFRRLQRRYQFMPMLKIETVANLTGTAIVWPALELTGDFSALLWVCLAQACAYVYVSHRVARRRYRVRFETAYLLRMFSFGWPILLNGLLMFGVFQGDRLIVALATSPDELSRYALALQLGLLPTLILARMCLSLLLPMLSRLQDDRLAFQIRYQQVQSLLIAISVVFIIGYVFTGNHLIIFLFGVEFELAKWILVWIGCALALRIMRICPVTAALARGDSRALMQVNLVRAAALAPAAVAGSAGSGLAAIAFCAALGELAALTYSIHLLHRRHNVSTPLYFVIAGVTAVTLIALSHTTIDSMSVLAAFGITILISIALYRANPQTLNSAVRATR